MGDVGRFRKGKQKTGGRLRGVANVVTTDCRKEILRGLAAYGSDGEGTDGIAGLVYAAVKADIRNAIPLLSVVTPKQMHADIHRTEVQLLSIEDLDRSLIASGLPPTDQLFARPTFPIDFKGSDPIEVEDVTEVEVAAEERPPK